VSRGSGGGVGGVSRGPGHVSLDYSGESSRASERFVEHALAPGALDLENSRLLGVGAGAPRTDPTAEASQQLPTVLSAGEASAKRRLSPQHREAVRSFFGGDKR
jgi:hypothetical protein